VADHSRAMTTAVLGAVAGAVVGYLLFTDRGRLLRRQCETALENAAHELNGLRSTLQKAAGFATEGWTMLNEALGERGLEAPRQSAPF